jgi:hypothetical protein
MPVLNSPDDVLRTPRGVPAEKHAGQGALEGGSVNHRHVPLTELDADVPLDPGERGLLPDREDHIVAGDADRLQHAAPLPPILFVPLHPVELHADQSAILHQEAAWGVILHDLHLFFLGILQLPRGGLEVDARPPGHHLHVHPAHPLGGAAAVHRRVPDPDDQDPRPDRFQVAEVNRFQPVDADVNVPGVVLTTGQIELLALRSAAAHEHGVEPLREQIPHAVDGAVIVNLHTHVHDVPDLLIQHPGWQAEGGDIGAHQPPGSVQLLEDVAVVTKGGEIVADRERGRAGADQSDPPAILLGRGAGQKVANLAPMVGRHPLESADGDRRALDPNPPAGGLAGTVAGAAQNSGKHVRFAVEQIALGEPALRDESNVLRHVGMGGACPLAVDYLVVVSRVADIGRGHGTSSGGERGDDYFGPFPESRNGRAWKLGETYETGLSSKHVCNPGHQQGSRSTDASRGEPSRTVHPSSLVSQRGSARLTAPDAAGSGDATPRTQVADAVHRLREVTVRRTGICLASGACLRRSRCTGRGSDGARFQLKPGGWS